MFAYFILFGLSVEFDQAFIDGCRNWIAFLILFPQTIRFVLPLSAPNKRSRPVDSMTNWTEQSKVSTSTRRQVYTFFVKEKREHKERNANSH